MHDPADKSPQSLQAGITICLAVYQAESFITATLAAIATQSYTNFRCIISDDASGDGTVAICRHFALQDSRFEVLENRQRLGWIGNVNRALAKIGAEYFMIASHDDVMAESYLELLLAALKAEQAAIVAFSDMTVVAGGCATLVKSYSLLERKTSPYQRAAGVISEQGTWWIPYRGLVRRSLLAQAPRLYNNCAGEFSADLPWVLSLAIAGQFVRVAEPLLTKHERNDSVSSQWKFTPFDRAAVLASCAGVVWKSTLPFPQRCLLLLLIPFRLCSKLASDGWQWIKKNFMGSTSSQADEY